MSMTSTVFQRPWLYGLLGKMARRAMRWLPKFVFYNRLKVWTKKRDLPAPPKKSFREIFAEQQRLEK